MGMSIAYDACRRSFLCRHREGPGVKFAKTIKGPFGPCHVTSQIVGFPTSSRFRFNPPRSDRAILYQPFGRFPFPKLKLLFRDY